VKYRLLKWLACPACGDPNLTLQTRRTDTRPVTHGHFSDGDQEPGVSMDEGVQTEVVEGALSCGGCGRVYLIRDGIPRMMVDRVEEGPESAHNWVAFDSEIPEWEADFQAYAAPMEPKSFLGKLVLDAGCGVGRHAFFAARYGAEVIAMDASGDAVRAAQKNLRDLAHVHVVQGDLYQPPIQERVCDIVYCFGVLHHLERPFEAARALGRSLQPGGRFAIWVYGPRQGVTLHASNILRGLTVGLEPDQLHQLSRSIASVLRLFSHTPTLWLGKLPVASALVTHLPVHDHYRWPFEIVVADIYDRLRVPVHHWFNKARLEKFLTDEGYADVQVTRRVRNNETYVAGGTKR
jgi:SAM-dependent methyltransferase